ncbi:hypothetical protein NHF46_23200 [Arthrobacter alpinus]|nr:hypothetical protein [Arthrobacter alpinus]
MIESMQSFTASLPPMLQWVGVLLVAAIPFVESYFGSVVGVVIGLNPVLAIGVAVVGNVLSMLVFVLSAHGVRVRFSLARRRRSFLPGGPSCAGLSTSTVLPV